MSNNFPNTLNVALTYRGQGSSRPGKDASQRTSHANQASSDTWTGLQYAPQANWSHQNLHAVNEGAYTLSSWTATPTQRFQAEPLTTPQHSDNSLAVRPSQQNPAWQSHYLSEADAEPQEPSFRGFIAPPATHDSLAIRPPPQPLPIPPVHYAHPSSEPPRSEGSLAVAASAQPPPAPPARCSPAQAKTDTEPLTPSWHGYIANTFDALQLVEAGMAGHIRHATRRPHDREKADIIKSGSVFLYEENASGIKRWTDGVNWSPSRVSGNFLMYRETEHQFPPGEKKRAVKRKRSDADVDVDSPDTTDRLPKKPSFARDQLTPAQQKKYCSSLVESYEFKEGGLMKKSINFEWQGAVHHIISYYSLEDVVVPGRLLRPCESENPKIRNTRVRQKLVEVQKLKETLEEEAARDSEGMASLPQVPQVQVPPQHYAPQYTNTMQVTPNWPSYSNMSPPQQPPQQALLQQPQYQIPYQPHQQAPVFHPQLEHPSQHHQLQVLDLDLEQPQQQHQGQVYEPQLEPPPSQPRQPHFDESQFKIEEWDFTNTSPYDWTTPYSHPTAE